MQIVINIPDEIIEYVNENNCLSVNFNDILSEAISNGIQLPKSHGRIIDADAIDYYEVERYGEKHYMCWKRHIDGLPTIIEATPAESEDK